MSRDETASPPVDRGWLNRWWPELAATAGWLGALAYLLPTRVSHDVAWQMWIARQMLGSVDLYSRIAEVNPPLWFWMAMPIEAIAPALGLTPIELLVLSVFGLVGVSLGLSAALVRHWQPAQRAAMFLGLLVVLIGLYMNEFEQREQLCLIAVVPYALLMARRRSGTAVDWRLALAVGLFAAPFLALKHYFVVIPLFLEIWLLLARKRAWRPLRPETSALVGVAAIYAAAVVRFEWDYVSLMVPRLQQAYGELRSSLFDVFINGSTIAVYLLLPYIWFVRKELAPEAKAMLLVGAGFAASYLFQFKGWQYHLVPAVSALVLVVILHLTLRPRDKELHIAAFGIAVFLVGLITVPVVISGRYESAYDEYAQSMLAGLTPGDTAVLLSTRPYIVWPMVEEMGLHWPSRYYHFWMLPAVYNYQAAGAELPPKLRELIGAVQLETVADLACNPPDRIIDDTDSVVGKPFDLLAMLQQEPRFADLMSAYEKYDTLGPFDLYNRVRPIPAQYATDCVAIH